MVPRPEEAQSSIAQPVEHSITSGVRRKIGDVVQIDVRLNARADLAASFLPNFCQNLLRGEGATVGM